MIYQVKIIPTGIARIKPPIIPDIIHAIEPNSPIPFCFFNIPIIIRIKPTSAPAAPPHHSENNKISIKTHPYFLHLIFSSDINFPILFID